MQPTVEITQQMSAMSISKKKRPSPYSKRPRRVPEIVIQRPSRNPTPMPSPKPIRKANSMPSSLDFDRMLSEIKHVDSQQKLQQTINEHWIQGGGKVSVHVDRPGSRYVYQDPRLKKTYVPLHEFFPFPDANI